MNSLRIRRSVQRAPAAEGSGGWHRLAHSVMRRPVLYAVPIVLVLLGLGSPFLKVVWGGVDASKAHAPQIVDDREGDARLLNGPKLDGDDGHASQNDIDALFD